MEIFAIIISVFCGLSLIGSVITFIMFFYFKNLRQGFFSHIVVYLSIGDLIQIAGIESSLFSSKCNISSFFLIYGSLVMINWSIIMIWAIKQLFEAKQEGELFEELEIKMGYLQSEEKKLVFISFAVPFLFAVLPFCVGSKHQTICYVQPSQQGQNIEIDIVKIMIWEVPIIIYIIYALYVTKQVRRLYLIDIYIRYGPEQDMFIQVRSIIRKVLLYPLITFICTIQFTVQDIQSFFQTSNIGIYQSTFSMSFLALWGLGNSIAYLSQMSVKQLLNSEQELNNMRQSTDSALTSSDYFYIQHGSKGNSNF
ncbi:hypothetical protein pb186bvf_004728 [Paramecium bursaria]